MGKAESSFQLRDTVGTPKEVYEPIVACLGPIGLDPCSHPGSLVPAAVRYYLPEYVPAGTPASVPLRVEARGEVPGHMAIVGDGLSLPWGPGLGLVYVNPPYSQLAEHPWLLRSLPDAASLTAPAKGARKRTMAEPAMPDEVLWFLPVRTAGSWWQRDLLAVADVVTFLRFRVKHTGEQNRSPFHQALAYRGPRAERWAAFASAELGWTVTL